jgi:hypothetical protein
LPAITPTATLEKKDVTVSPRERGQTMAGKKISRNDPCPCGSGRKFKHCCLHKGTGQDARQQSGAGRLPWPAAPRPRPHSEDFIDLDPFRVVDDRLKGIAAAAPATAEWKERVERLSAPTSGEERLEAYRLVRRAGVLPDEAAGFLFGHAIQWMPAEGAGEDEEAGDTLHRLTLATLRRHGQDDLADLYAGDRVEYDRRYERGRQFFFGPPDEELAEILRRKGIIG